MGYANGRTFFACGVQVQGLEEVVHVGMSSCALHMLGFDDVCRYGTEIMALIAVVACAVNTTSSITHTKFKNIMFANVSIFDIEGARPIDVQVLRMAL